MAKQAAIGANIKITSGTVVGNVTSIKGPGLSVDTVDVTTHDSTSAWEEVVATIVRSGEITVELVYDPANAQIKNAAGGLLYNMVNKTKTNITLTTAGGSAFVFDSYITGFEPDMSADGALTGTLKIKPTGAVTVP